MMYHAIASKLTEEGRVELDALLGDPVAEGKLDEQRVEMAVDAGFEVG